MKSFEYARPDSIETASAMAAEKGSRIKAGGTDLLGLMKEKVASPERVISIDRLDGLHGITERANGGFSIGASTTLDEIVRHRELGQRFPVLVQAAGSVASHQLRNIGTLGGNLCQRPRCWYFRRDFDCIRKGGDTCFAFDGENRFHCVTGGGPCFIVHPSDTAVALLAMDATLLVRNGTDQKAVPVREFYVLPETDPTVETILGPGDILTAIQIPAPLPGLRSVYQKHADRAVFDFATVSVAIYADVRSDTIHSIRVALGGVAPVPWLQESVGRNLTGISVNDTAAINRAAGKALQDTMPLEQNGYKIALARNMIADAVAALQS